jgi:putative peptidoglycan lipid II flippase
MLSKSQILRRSAVVGFFSLLGGLTGILVDTSIAAYLGLSRESDAFYVAFTIPYVITNVMSATGQFSLVPFFSALEGKDAAGELGRGFSYAVNGLLLGLVGLAALGALSAPWAVRLIAPGFTAAQTELAAQLSRWLFLMIVPAGVAEVFRSFLFSRHSFVLSSAAGLFRNVTVIAFILLTFKRYGAYSIVLGYLAGYFVQFAVLGAQIVLAYPVRYAWTLAGSGAAFRNLRGAGTAQVASATAWQGVVLVERVIASFLPAGTLTALTYGFKIMSTMSELLAGSAGTAALPSLSRAAARQDRELERRTFRNTLEIALAATAPATVFCLMLSAPIMRLVFERGNFTAEATALMAAVFFHYSLSLVPFGFIRVLTFYLFARNAFGLFFRLSLLLYGLTVAFDLLFVGALRLGARGIPWGLLAALAVVCALLYRRDVAAVRGVLDRALGAFALKNLLGAGLAALAVAVLARAFAEPAATGARFVYLALLCGAGSVAFYGTLFVTRAVPVARLGAIFRPPEGV